MQWNFKLFAFGFILSIDNVHMCLFKLSAMHLILANFERNSTVILLDIVAVIAVVAIAVFFVCVFFFAWLHCYGKFKSIILKMTDRQKKNKTRKKITSQRSLK